VSSIPLAAPDCEMTTAKASCCHESASWLFSEGQNRTEANVERILKEDTKEQKDTSQGEQRTIFHTLRDSDLPAYEKSLQRLCDEAEIILGAGSETTAAVLSRIWFYLLHTPFDSRDSSYRNPDHYSVFSLSNSEACSNRASPVPLSRHQRRDSHQLQRHNSHTTHLPPMRLSAIRTGVSHLVHLSR